jgi:hypothetical protein
MTPQSKVQGVSIVVRGDLNPAIFQPYWFSQNNLIKLQEAEAAIVKIVCPDVTVFETGWLQVQVVRDRFQVSTFQDAYYEPLRDLVNGTFTLLYHTPARVLGINMDFHFDMGAEKPWNTVGDVLAPKSPWQAILTDAKMRSIIIEGRRPDEYSGYIRVAVEPSDQVLYGVHVSINDHFQARQETGANLSAAGIVEVLHGQWEKSLERGYEMATRVAALGG